MRAHRRVAVVGVVVLVLGAAFAAGVVAIATGRSGHDAVVFARTAKLTAARGAVAKGLITRRHRARLAARRRQANARIAGRRRRGDRTSDRIAHAGRNGERRQLVRRLLVVAAARANRARRAGAGARPGQPVGVPSIRLFDLRSGKDALLAQRGGVAGRLDERRDRVSRRREPDRPAERRLRRPDRRRRLAQREAARLDEHAGALPARTPGRATTLLVHRGVPDSEGADLYAYTGPDEARLLAPDAFAIAVSPDGTKVLASVGIRTLEVIRIADAAIEDTLSLDARLARTTRMPSCTAEAGRETGSSPTPTAGSSC